MDTSRELAPPLTDLLYTMAEDGADAEATNMQKDVWAGLLRDGADVTQRLTEQIEMNRDEIDADDWADHRGRQHRRAVVRADAPGDDT